MTSSFMRGVWRLAWPTMQPTTASRWSCWSLQRSGHSGTTCSMCVMCAGYYPAACLACCSMPTMLQGCMVGVAYLPDGTLSHGTSACICS